MTNRLAREPSPYLQQHANNPVDWYPWGDEAFERARREDKPIFLSIGYSTCHWCHVMEHESFEHAGIAQLLNEHFVSIKVDREERPDVDRVYMAFVQATTGAGGWPMSVWLTPDLKPFFGGTYFPPGSRWGRPGFPDILREVSARWKSNRGEILQSADGVLERLREMHGASGAGGAAADDPIGRGVREVSGAGAAVAGSGTASGSAVPGVDAIAAGVQQFAATFDTRHGGFGGAPKFPRPSELLFLLRESARSGDFNARRIAVATLEAMASGGVRDHLGGGFHRYSVDAGWRVPHFEKMLYDQAQLVLAYLEAGQAAGAGALLQVAEDTIEYVRRDMTSSEGAFYSAEDADSLPPEAVGTGRTAKAEGAFYLWTEAEVDALLGADAEVAKRRLGIEAGGNAPQDPMGEFRGKCIPYLQQDVGEIAKLTGRSAEDVAAALGAARRTLFEARAERPRPHLDDKVLAAWNGLMIAALARAGHVLDGPAAERSLQAAGRAADFARERLWDPERRVLQRRFRDGAVSIDGYAEDYAYLVWGLLELFQTSGEVEWLEWAIQLQERQDALFWDEAGDGWFATTGGDPSVLLRIKEEHDGAEPAAGSVAVENLLTLTHLREEPSAAARAERTLARVLMRFGQAARVAPMMMAGLVRFHAPATQVVIVGEPGADDTRALERIVAGRYLPFAVRLRVAPGDHQTRLAERLPFVGALRAVDGRATAYVCTNFTCQEPTTSPARLDELLARAGR